MLAIVNTPQGPQPVEIRDVPEPQPKPNEALVEVRAFGLNRGELTLLRTRPEGWRPGQDIAGVVVRRAEDGSGPNVGARVVALVDSGGWAQLAAAPTARMTELPENVSFADAATLPVAGITALRTLRFGGLLLGKRVVVTGAAGGVGQFAVQLADRAGAYVTAVAANTERGEEARELGADEVISGMGQLQGLHDLILESVGGDSLKHAVEHIAPDGTIVMFGMSSGQPTEISFRDFVGHANARIQSFFSYLSGPPESFGADLRVLVSLVARGELKPRIGFQGSWRDLARAAQQLGERQLAGKAVFFVD